MVTRWFFDVGGGSEYEFPRNPDRYGGDTFWVYESVSTEIDMVNANLPSIQLLGFRGSRRILRFTAITGTMLRKLQDFYLANVAIENCRDHLYPTSPEFDCVIEGFVPTVHPSSGNFPGSGEDTYDLEITLVKIL